VRERIHEAMSLVIEKASGDKFGSALERIEKSLYRYLTKCFRDRANKAVGSALSVIQGGNQDAPVTRAQAEQMLSRREAAFEGIDTQTAKRVGKDMAAFYKTNKSGFARPFSLKPMKETKKSDLV